MSKFRLPSKEDFERLSECFSRYDNELKGRWYLDKSTGDELFLPGEGSHYKTEVVGDVTIGHYWSRTLYNNEYAHYFHFDSNYFNPRSISAFHFGYSVRIVSDTPFKDSIHVAGLYWKQENEPGYYTWHEAIDLVKTINKISNLRLPTKEEFDRLSDCYFRFDSKGRWFLDKSTGEELFLPAVGYRDDTTVYHIDSYGYYWTSTCYDRNRAYCFLFSNSDVSPSFNGGRGCGRSVRLVSDEPFEGSVLVAGLFWKPANEDGYYTWDEAMEHFNG